MSLHLLLFLPIDLITSCIEVANKMLFCKVIVVELNGLKIIIILAFWLMLAWDVNGGMRQRDKEM